jgi:hypothetical protein
MDKIETEKAINIVQKVLTERRLIMLDAIRQAQIAHGGISGQVVALKNIYDELLLASSIIEKYRDCW